MSRNLILYLWLCTAINAPAQSPVTYDYDATGNRISRTGISVNAKKAKHMSQKNTHSTRNQANASTLSYDETSGIITVSLYKSQAGPEASLSVFSLSGGLVYCSKIPEGKYFIGTSSFPSGTYVASIETGNKKQAIKFTKE